MRLHGKSRKLEGRNCLLPSLLLGKLMGKGRHGQAGCGGVDEPGRGKWRNGGEGEMGGEANGQGTHVRKEIQNCVMFQILLPILHLCIQLIKTLL